MENSFTVPQSYLYNFDRAEFDAVIDLNVLFNNIPIIQPMKHLSK